MPRKAKGARLYQRSSEIYYIRDTDGSFVTTRTRDRGEAESALARYIVERGRPTGPASPENMTCDDVLDLYGTERAPLLKSRARIGGAIQALVPVLGSVPVAGITAAVCRRYAAVRGVSDGTVRLELQLLQTAINYCVGEGYLTHRRKVSLPAMPDPRDRWLTRDEVAALIRTARKKSRTRHLVRFILIAVYTGTRSSAILNLRFMPHTLGGHIDTEAGILYRRAAGQTETKKRTPPAPIPPRLLAHLRRWERMGATWAVEYNGARVGSLKRVWGSVLRDAGIDHATKHDLRHTAATWLMQAGAPTWSAAGFLGMTVQILERVYGHHHPDHLQGALDASARMRNTG